MPYRLNAITPRALATTFTLLVAACGASGSSLGTFKVNNKAASLSSAVLVGMPPTSNVPRMVLVLSEKAPPTGVNANEATIADPNAFGAAINVVLLKNAGEHWSNSTGCSIAHPASKSKHGNYLDANACKLTDVSVANGEFHAHLTTPPSTKDHDDRDRRQAERENALNRQIRRPHAAGSGYKRQFFHGTWQARYRATTPGAMRRSNSLSTYGLN